MKLSGFEAGRFGPFAETAVAPPERIEDANDSASRLGDSISRAPRLPKTSGLSDRLNRDVFSGAGPGSDLKISSLWFQCVKRYRWTWELFGAGSQTAQIPSLHLL